VEETHRLATQIQAAARSRAESGIEAQAELEQRITRWLEHWNQGFRQYLHQREQHLIGEMRSELEQTRAWVNARLEEHTHTSADRARLQASFSRLAEAAREVAEAAGLHIGRKTGGEA
jgi:hypothetical protein